MEEGSKKTKGQKRASGKADKHRSQDMYERRPLKTVQLVPPEYNIDPHILLSDYVEKEIRYVGIVPGISIDLDPTNRTDILRAIDEGKREGRIPWNSKLEHDCIICLNVHNIKISQRTAQEEVMLRIPTHEIAAVSYIKDDDRNILCVKFGDDEEEPDFCKLAVFYCDTTATAEELCSLINQCFQLVYTDATMQYFDTELSAATSGLSIGKNTLTYRSRSNSIPNGDSFERDQTKMSFFSQSSLDLEYEYNGSGGGTLSSNTSRSLPRVQRRNSISRSESELSDSARELLKDYLKVLHNKLNHDELSRFAKLLEAKKTRNIGFHDFCEKVFELYGPDRKYLLAGLRPFIHEGDLLAFEAFLHRVGASNGVMNEMSKGSISRRNRRAASNTALYGAAGGQMDEYDRRLQDISSNIDNSSVDMATNPEVFLPDS